MDFLLFLLVNAILFLRPAELVPGWEGLPIYQGAILACLVASIPALLGLTMGRSPLSHPLAWCVISLLPMIVLSHLVNSDLDKAFEQSFEFFKVEVYFVLALAVVNTPRRLRVFLGAVVIFGVIITSIAILQRFELIQLAHLRDRPGAFGVEESWSMNPETGETERLVRLQVTGILQDPNEFCVFLGCLSLLALAQLFNKRSGVARVLWVLPLALFLFGMALTQSRGGLLALFTGLGTYGIYAFGGRRALLYGALVLPLLFVVFAGRQTSISVREGTANARINLWSDWFHKFRGAPVFGVGPRITPEEDVKKEFVWDREQLAHNSFVQGFADLGFFGGLIFLGTFFFAFMTLSRYGFGQTWIVDPDLRGLHPFLMGLIAAYAMGLMTLTLNYVLPTYFILSLPLIYWRLAASYPSVPRPRLNAATVGLVIALGIGFLGFIYVFVLLFRS